MQMRKINTLSLLAIFSSVILLINGCWSLRSAQGLSEGELNVNYVAPLAGSIRYGVTDNVESRFILAGESINGDVFIHTNTNDRKINYGLMFGINDDSQKSYYTGIVSSIKISKYVSPYLSTIFIYNPEIKRIDYEQSYLSLGSDVRIPITNHLAFLITPEVGHFIKYKHNADFNTRGWILTGNVGLIYNLY